MSININDGLDLNGQLNPRIGALGGTGNLDLGSLSLNTGLNAASSTYAGRLSGTSASALVHNGPGTLTLTEASTYTGDTIVEEGVLSLAKVFLSDSASLVLDSNATLNLTHGMTDTVDEFYLGGIARGAGTHGAVESGADFEYAQITGTGMLRVFPIPALAGDYNNDGIVGIADYTAWRDNLGAPAGTLTNDIDGGKIGVAQYSTWKARFGDVLGSGSFSSTKVPEPASLWLVILIGIAVTMRRRFC